MASCKSVVVVCPNARRQTVKVGPTTTILQILDEVCKKQGLSSQEFAIKHQRNILDETVPVRYSGLTNNAHLELVAQIKTSKTGAQCTVGLQLASGERLIKEFPPTHTLWDVISHWNSLDGSPNSGQLFGEAGQVTVCVYMTQKITGESDLKNTTLHNLGLTGKRAIIRLLHETSSVQEKPEEVEMVSPTDSPEKAPASASAPPQQHHTVAQDPRTDSAKSMPAPMEIPCTANPGTDSTTNMPAPMEIPCTANPGTNSNKSMPAPMEIPRPEVHGSTSAVEDRTSDSVEVGNNRQRPLEPGTVSPERGPRDPKYSRTAAGLPKLFPNFKFPEKPVNQDLSKAETTENLFVSEERKHLLSTPCDRVPLVFSENDMSTSPGSDQADLPDSFFEVTVDDIRKMLQDLHSDRVKNDNSPLMTKSMKEARKFSDSYKYEKVVLRVKFPDRLTLQGFFRPHEKVSVLSEFVKSHLANPTASFYLYTSPPRTVLKNQDSTLYEADLCPASLVYFGSDDKQEHYLATSHLDSLVTMLDAEQAVLQSKGKTATNETTRHQSPAGQTAASNGAGTSSVTSQPRGDLAGTNTSVNRPSTSSKGAVPKWFKGTGK